MFCRTNQRIIWITLTGYEVLCRWLLYKSRLGEVLKQIESNPSDIEN